MFGPSSNLDDWVNNFTFTSNSPAEHTTLNWTWTNPDDALYLYFDYPNMSIPVVPFSYPTARPSMSPSFDDDDFGNDDYASAMCKQSACPTSCSKGHTSAYSMSGCTVYCKDTPHQRTVRAGAARAVRTSSCRDISVETIIGLIVGGVAFIVILSVAVGVWYCRKPLADPKESNDKVAQITNPIL